MNKCREEFLRWLKTATLKVARAPDGGYYWTDIEHERSLWQAAWNARGKTDVEICLSCQSSERFLSDYDQGIYYARNECAENIEQENEK